MVRLNSTTAGSIMFVQDFNENADRDWEETVSSLYSANTDCFVQFCGYTKKMKENMIKMRKRCNIRLIRVIH